MARLYFVPSLISLFALIASPYAFAAEETQRTDTQGVQRNDSEDAQRNNKDDTEPTTLPGGLGGTHSQNLLDKSGKVLGSGGTPKKFNKTAGGETQFCASQTFPDTKKTFQNCLTIDSTASNPDICGYTSSELTYPAEPYHLLFYTSTYYKGDLGGFTGADAICQAEAEKTNSVVKQLKPAARWRAFLARPGKKLPDIGISWRGDIYALPMSKSLNPAAPRNNFVMIIRKNGTMPGGRPPTQTCGYPGVCNSGTYTHGGYHHWTGAQSDGDINTGSNCSNWTSNAVTGSTGDGGWGLDNSDRFYDGGAALHSCNYPLPLGCVSE